MYPPNLLRNQKQKKQSDAIAQRMKHRIDAELLRVPEGRHNVAHRGSGGEMCPACIENPDRGDTWNPLK